MEQSIRFLACCVILGTCVACTPQAPSGSTGGARTPTPTASPAALEMPERIPGTAVLKEVSPISGNQTPGEIMVQPGDLWVSATCQGNGRLEISLSPGMKLEIPCEASKPKYSKNKDARPAEQKLDVRVSAPDDVYWSLRIEQ